MLFRFTQKPKHQKSKMSRIFKVCIQGQEVIAIKPYLDNFQCFKEEIFIRKPDLKNKNLRFAYDGKICMILLTAY